jgi:hypothetical protein
LPGNSFLSGEWENGLNPPVCPKKLSQYRGSVDRNVPWLSERNGPGGDFTTDRMCFAQLGHFSTSAK